MDKIVKSEFYGFFPLISKLFLQDPPVRLRPGSLYSILQQVSEEFEIDPADRLNYLKEEKKYGNNSFHLNVDITRYVSEHTNYDFNQF